MPKYYPINEAAAKRAKDMYCKIVGQRQTKKCCQGVPDD